MFALSEEAALNFQVSASFLECPSKITCAEFTAILSKDPVYSSHRMDFVNSFKYDPTTEICEAGKIWNEYILDKTQDHIDPVTDEDGIFVQTGCYFQQGYNFTATTASMSLTDLYFYYPGDGTDLAYYRSGLSLVYADRGAFPQYGSMFFHGGQTLMTTIANYDYRVK